MNESQSSASSQVDGRDSDSISIFSGKSTPRRIKRWKKSESTKKGGKLDEIPELSENVNELMEHTKAATIQLFVVILQLLKMILSLVFGKIHDFFTLVFTRIFRVLFFILKRLLLSMIMVYLFLQNVCPKKGKKNPFNNKSKLDILKKLDKIWEFKKKILVLDLDQTLVKTSRHKLVDLDSQEETEESPSDFKSPNAKDEKTSKPKTLRKLSKKSKKNPKAKKKGASESSIETVQIRLKQLDEADLTLYCYLRPYLHEFLDKVSISVALNLPPDERDFRYPYLHRKRVKLRGSDHR